MPAEQLDLELSILFQNADKRAIKKKQKKISQIDIPSSESESEEMK